MGTEQRTSGDGETKEAKELAVRGKVARELVATEDTYCRAIKSIVMEFLNPIKAEKILKPGHITTIFANIEQILNLHSSVLPDLELCVENWSDASCIGETFTRLVPYLKLYKSYCANYNEALLRVAERMENSKQFANLVQTKKEMLQLDLSSLLIQPVQRIPRYKLLFAEILKYTPTAHPDYRPASECLVQIEDIAIYVNESVREKENQDKLHQVEQSLVGSKIPEIVSPTRKFMREGTLVKMCRREPKRRYFFLFNDLLIYSTVNEINVNTAKTYTFHRAMTLDKLRVEDISDAEGLSNAFQILSNQKSFTVFAESASDKKIWMDDINRAIQLCYELNNDTTGGSGIAPVWIPDKLLKNCMLCNVKFTTITRRHHCRKCGKLVCGNCSSKKFMLDNIGKVCRVCDECFNHLSGLTTERPSTGTVVRSRSSTNVDVCEAQNTLNKRATKKFRNEDKQMNFTTSFLPAVATKSDEQINASPFATLTTSKTEGSLPIEEIQKKKIRKSSSDATRKPSTQKPTSPRDNFRKKHTKSNSVSSSSTSSSNRTKKKRVSKLAREESEFDSSDDEKFAPSWAPPPPPADDVISDEEGEFPPIPDLPPPPPPEEDDEE